MKLLHQVYMLLLLLLQLRAIQMISCLIPDSYKLSYGNQTPAFKWLQLMWEHKPSRSFIQMELARHFIKSITGKSTVSPPCNYCFYSYTLLKHFMLIFFKILIKEPLKILSKPNSIDQGYKFQSVTLQLRDLYKERFLTKEAIFSSKLHLGVFLEYKIVDSNWAQKTEFAYEINHFILSWKIKIACLSFHICNPLFLEIRNVSEYSPHFHFSLSSEGLECQFEKLQELYEVLQRISSHNLKSLLY